MEGSMRRREFITLLGGAAAAWPLAGHSQVPVRRPLIALLFATSRYGAGFVRRMQELGYMAGREIDIVHRHIEGDLSRIPALVDELLRLKPDVLVASNTQAAIAMSQATATVPIVAANFTDPVGFGLIASHARPGGNVTGILASVDTLPEKQLALASEALRGTVKMGMLFNAGFQAHTIMRKGAEQAAATLTIKLVSVGVRSPDDLDAAFQSMARERVAGVLVLQDPMFISERRRIAMLAIAARLPTMFGFRENVEAGGLMSYGINLDANFRRAADFVDKILKGAKPGDLPVELPTKYELVINLQTARALGLAVPPTLLSRADAVIE
jgi:putative ABC transport system substrate-binding protein